MYYVSLWAGLANMMSCCLLRVLDYQLFFLMSFLFSHAFPSPVTKRGSYHYRYYCIPYELIEFTSCMVGNIPTVSHILYIINGLGETTGAGDWLLARDNGAL